MLIFSTRPPANNNGLEWYGLIFHAIMHTLKQERRLKKFDRGREHGQLQKKISSHLVQSPCTIWLLQVICVGVCRRSQTLSLVGWDPIPLGMLPTCHHAEFGRSTSNRTNVNVNRSTKNGPLAAWPWVTLLQGHSRSSEPTDWSTTYDFLLVIHSSCGSISYRFPVNGDFGCISQIFPTPVYLMPCTLCIL